MSNTLTLRQIGPADTDSMKSFLERLSDHDRYMRFLRPMPRVTPALVDALCASDGTLHVAIGAFDEDRLVGAARYVTVRDDPRRAELAFSVDPSHRGRGLARRLVSEVIRAAEEGIPEWIEVYIHPENQAAAGLVRSLGFALKYRDGLLEGTAPVSDLAVRC